MQYIHLVARTSSVMSLGILSSTKIIRLRQRTERDIATAKSISSISCFTYTLYIHCRDESWKLSNRWRQQCFADSDPTVRFDSEVKMQIRIPLIHAYSIIHVSMWIRICNTSWQIMRLDLLLVGKGQGSFLRGKCPNILADCSYYYPDPTLVFIGILLKARCILYGQ